jgi:small-conductance mechanosensitive channel
MSLQWSSVTRDALIEGWYRIVNSLPNLLGAIVIMIIGVLVANILKWLIERLVLAIRLQEAFEQLDFAKSLKKAGLSTNLGALLGEFVRWVIIILFLLPAASILGLSQVSSVLNQIIAYLPNVGSAIIILFIGALFAEFLGNVIRATAAGLGTRASVGLAVVARYIIYVFAALAALSQLGIAPQIINIVLTGIVAASAIAFGLAFGLGGKEAAADLIAKIRQDFSK